MQKRHFIALADVIRRANNSPWDEQHFRDGQIDKLASFCQSQNPRFDRDRWLGYIAGTCGPNGGKV